MKCDKCEKIFSNERNLKKHQWVHSGETDSIHSKYYSTTCPHCPMKFQRRYMVIKHVKTNHEEIWKKITNKPKQKPENQTNFCTDCDLQFVTFESKTNHMKDHICDHCQTRFESPRNVAKHLMDLWKEDQKQNVLLKAKIFKMESQPKTSFDDISDESKNDTIETMNQDQTFSQNQHSASINAEAHVNNETNPDDDISDETKNDIIETMNQDQTFSDNQHSQDDTIFACKVCRKTFNSKEACIDHYINHHLGHKCKRCGDGFSNATTLKTHQQKCSKSDKLKKSQEEKLSCDQCGKTFMNRSILRIILLFNKY